MPGSKMIYGMNIFRCCTFLLTLYKLTDSRVYEESETDIPDEFDYIIIGGGTAGSVIANRLSEDQSKSILVLEAGGKDRDIPESSYISTPALWTNMFTTNLMWKYKTEPQTHAFFGYPNNSFNVEMGRVLGGSSSVHLMLYTRGFKSDYDSWAEKGAKGWSYKDVLPFFLKPEGAIPSDNTGMSSGQLSFSDAIMSDPAKLAYQAAKEAGVTEHDSRDPNPMGMRNSASDAYLWPVVGRPNLHVITGAQVEKVMIDDRTKEVQGVLYMFNKRDLFARARLEVIISAGPYGSPKILMLSGIGPSGHLRDIGIDVLADLPVGNNLRQINIRPFSGLVGLADVNCFIRSPQLRTERHEPIANVIWVNGNMDAVLPGDDDGKTVGECEKERNNVEECLSVKGMMSAYPMTAHPRSVGYVRLRSRNYTELPLINPKFLSKKFDVKVLLESIRFVQKMLKTPSLRKVNARFPPPSSACLWFPYDTDAYWECYIRHFAVPTYHGIGTCRMGEGHHTVVDSRLRVKGVKRIRVADASVMPSSPSSNTQAAVYMIAEKAAHMIKEDVNS